MTYLGVLRFNPDVDEPVMLVQASELNSFGYFQRGRCEYFSLQSYVIKCSVKEMITFFSKTIAKRTPPGQRQSVQNEGIPLN